MFKDYLKLESPTDLTKQLFRIKNKNNSELVSVIESGLIDLKNEIKKTPKREKNQKTK